MKGTMSACMCVEVESEPVPVMLTLTVVGLLQPAETVLLPVRLGVKPTTVMAGALPDPPYDRFTVK